MRGSAVDVASVEKREGTVTGCTMRTAPLHTDHAMDVSNAT